MDRESLREVAERLGLSEEEIKEKLLGELEEPSDEVSVDEPSGPVDEEIEHKLKQDQDRKEAGKVIRRPKPAEEFGRCVWASHLRTSFTDNEFQGRTPSY